jgi:hypothetical protein
MRNDIKGSKYEATAGLDIVAVAKLVRADVAAAIASGDLPADCKVKVRIERFSGGRAINAFIALPVVRCSESACAAGRANLVPKPWLTRVAYNAELTVQAILDAYNYDRCDIQSDSFDVRFYSTVSANSTEQVAA